MRDDDEDFVEFDDEGSGPEADVDNIQMRTRGNRSKRSWRDIERLREQRELDRLIASDSWFDDLDHA